MRGFSRRLDLLVPPLGEWAEEFKELVRRNEELERQGANVSALIYCTFRDEYAQARLYRRNRTLKRIEEKARSLSVRGFPALSEILLQTPPQPGRSGRVLTNAGPGESMHQHCIAFDAVPCIDGKPLWMVFEPDGSMRAEWRAMEQAGEEVGLEWLGHSNSFREYVHWEHRFGRSLDGLMRERYG